MRETLLQILEANRDTRVPGRAIDWLTETVADQAREFQRRPFYYAFSGVSRHFDKRGGFDLSPGHAAELESDVPGFTVARWDQYRLARVILLTLLAEQEKGEYLATLHALHNTADIRETQALYSAYPLLPHPEELVESAVDGLRTNIVEIYDAIALDNPFPTTHFTEEQWNQMVLKALFIHRPLYRIQGLDQRANAALAEAISDLAHERWAAGRTINPEAWRCCAPFLSDTIVADLTHLAEKGGSEDHDALALILAADTTGTLEPLKERATLQLTAQERGPLTWKTLGQHLEMNR